MSLMTSMASIRIYYFRNINFLALRERRTLCVLHSSCVFQWLNQTKIAFCWALCQAMRRVLFDDCGCRWWSNKLQIYSQFLWRIRYFLVLHCGAQFKRATCVWFTCFLLFLDKCFNINQLRLYSNYLRTQNRSKCLGVVVLVLWVFDINDSTVEG